MPELLVRTLRRDEREAVLALLDEWQMGHPIPGRVFFRRYVEHDPSYADENFWVAEQGGALVSCVQIFPKRIRVAGGGVVPVGGIGSVFTTEKARGDGVSSALLEAATDAMRARGMPLSLLFASRHGFYGRLGWRLWPRPRPLWLRGAATVAPDASRRVERFDAEHDLDAVIALHAAYSAPLVGSVVRDRAYWEGQLHFAGNPEEDFLVARDASGRIEAYARGCLLDGMYFVTELGHAGAPAAAADLVVRLMTARDPDPIAAAAKRGSEEVRRVAVAPPLADAGFVAALAAAGVETKQFAERAAMFRILDRSALEGCAGAAHVDGESDEEMLARLLPPEQLVFWAADRF